MWKKMEETMWMKKTEERCFEFVQEKEYDSDTGLIPIRYYKVDLDCWSWRDIHTTLELFGTTYEKAKKEHGIFFDEFLARVIALDEHEDIWCNGDWYECDSKEEVKNLLKEEWGIEK